MSPVRTITIDLIRHAPTIYEKGTLPPYDPAPDLSDQAMITALARRLPRDAAWWVSPLSRCVLTAQALKAAGASPRTEDVIDILEEQRHGAWHGKPVAEIWAAVQDGPQSNWHFLHPSTCPPDGESFDDLIMRLKPLYDRIIASSERHIVIIAHGMVIRALVGMAMGFANGQSLAMAIGNLSRTTLTYMAEGARDDEQSGGQWYLDRLNEGY